MKKLNVFLIEDQLIIRQALSNLINSQPDMNVIGSAGREATSGNYNFNIGTDVLVLDTSLIDHSNESLISQIKLHYPQLKILMLAERPDTLILRRLLRFGASGCILTSIGEQTFFAAIRDVAEGKLFLDRVLTDLLVAQAIGTSGKKQPSQTSKLSSRETEVVRQIAQGHKSVEIAKQMNLSIKTVDTYRARAMDKLDLRNRADLINYATQHGWV